MVSSSCSTSGTRHGNQVGKLQIREIFDQFYTTNKLQP